MYSHSKTPLSTSERILNPIHKVQRKVCCLSPAQTPLISINPTSTVGLGLACVNPLSRIRDEKTSLALDEQEKKVTDVPVVSSGEIEIMWGNRTD